MDTFTAVTHNYISAFSSFSHQFLVWGQYLFASFLALNFCWIFIWYAFDKECFTKSLSSFFKRFMGIMIFYTLMLNPSWLLSMLTSVHFMGKEITGLPLDPSSVISMGIALSNKTIAPVLESSLLSLGFSMIVIMIVYLVINFTFITIALELALTLITTTALISVATFFLGFSALSVTSNIARSTLDVILGNCFRLLGIYLVIGAGSHTIQTITQAIPAKIIAFDQYVWVVASCLLFWLLAKNFPNQLARIASISVQDHQGTDSASLAMSSLHTAGKLKEAVTIAKSVLAASGVSHIAKVAGSAAYHAMMQVVSHKKAGSSVGGAVTKGLVSTTAQVSNATLKTLGDHITHAANKAVGGEGIAKSHSHIPGISSRMYAASENTRMLMANPSAASSSSTQSSASVNQNTSSNQTSKDTNTLSPQNTESKFEKQTVKTSIKATINPHSDMSAERIIPQTKSTQEAATQETATWNQASTIQEG